MHHGIPTKYTIKQRNNNSLIALKQLRYFLYFYLGSKDSWSETSLFSFLFRLWEIRIAKFSYLPVWELKVISKWLRAFNCLYLLDKSFWKTFPINKTDGQAHKHCLWRARHVLAPPPPLEPFVINTNQQNNPSGCLHHISSNYTLFYDPRKYDTCALSYAISD